MMGIFMEGKGSWKEKEPMTMQSSPTDAGWDDLISLSPHHCARG